jgi:hypothetical protein
MLDIPMKVLRKAGPSEALSKVSHEGIRLIYAGGTYYGRDKTLIYVADTVRKLNQQGEKVQLDTYTGSPMKASIRKKLDDGKFCHVHGVIPFDELLKQYAASDIALHVESFQKKNALLTRLSFSTKIVDCLASGCAVVAICPKINAGWQYLRDEKAAICIDDVKQVYEILSDLICNNKIEASAQRAKVCLKANHEYHIIRDGLQKSLLKIANGESK